MIVKILTHIVRATKNIFSSELSKYIWRKNNKHNRTYLANARSDTAFPMSKVRVGFGTYGPLNVFGYGAHNESLNIGSYCSIGQGVEFILGGNHYSDRLLTYPFDFFYGDGNSNSYSKGGIIVGDDVWFGRNVMVLSGVHVGQGTIVGAGSVLTKSTEPYSIVAGNPAKLIKFRFSSDLIDKLLAIDLCKINPKFIRGSLSVLRSNIDLESVDAIISSLKSSEN